MATKNVKDTENVINGEFTEVNEDGTPVENTSEAETKSGDKQTLFEAHPKLGFTVKLLAGATAVGAVAFGAWKFGSNIKHKANKAEKVATLALGKATNVEKEVKRLSETAVKPAVENIVENVSDTVPEVVKDATEAVINN